MDTCKTTGIVLQFYACESVITYTYRLSVKLHLIDIASRVSHHPHALQIISPTQYVRIFTTYLNNKYTLVAPTAIYRYEIRL